ncbi:MAG: caspase family protein, partial [Bacteroidota bacterium]
CGTLTAFDPSSQYLFKLSNGTSFVKYDVSSGEAIWETKKEFDDISSVDVHSSGNHFLAATEDSVFVYQSKTHKQIAAWFLEGEVEDASFHPSEDQVLVALGKVTILYDFQGNEIKRYQGILNESKNGLDYDLGNYWERYIAKWVKYKSVQMMDGNAVFIGKTANKFRKWDINTASIKMEYFGHESGVLSFERIDERYIASGDGNGKIMIWDEASGKMVKQIEAHREPVFDLELSHDGRFLASCAWDGVIRIWNTDDWSEYTYVYNEGNSAYNIRFTSNDAYLVTGLLDKTLRLWEKETKRFVREFVGHTDVVTAIQISNGEVLTSGWDGQVILWDLYSGLIKQRIEVGRPCFSALFFKDQIITAGADRLITFWDKEGNKKEELKGHQAEINGLQINENVLISTDVDGTTKFWDLTKKTALYEHIQIGRNDWMVKTPEGYFDATDRAMNAIHFIKGMEAYGSSQFLDEFYKPGLVKNIFSDTRTGKTSIDQVIENAPPPTLKFSGVISDHNQAELFLKAEDKGGGVKDLKVFHNGRRVSFQKQLTKTRDIDKQSKVYTMRIPMVAGINEFAASASSKTNVESNRVSLSLFSQSKVPGSTCHLLAVGINEYANQSLNLNYARPDASSFASQMKTQGASIYSNVILHQVFDQDATKEGILNKIQEIKDQISVNDVFIFYYAGHGSMIDDKFYLVSSNASRLYDNQRMEEFGIEARLRQQAMLEVKALKQLIIMDACQSGGSVETLAQRGAPEEKAIAQLSRSSGIHVMAAAGSEQYATEFESLGHGLFTYALLKGLSGEADGAPKDGKVTIYELKSYLDDQVPALSVQYKGSPQYPHTFSRGQDFPIVIVE